MILLNNTNLRNNEENLLLENPDVDVVSYHFASDRIKGLYCNNTIAVSDQISTSAERTCILAEELGHHYTTTGDIIDQTSIANIKQERTARIWAYDRMIGLAGIVKVYHAHCQNSCEMAELLGVTEEFLADALEVYRQKYGVYTRYNHYIIYFEPRLGVMEII